MPLSFMILTGICGFLVAMLAIALRGAIKDRDVDKAIVYAVFLALLIALWWSLNDLFAALKAVA